MPKHAAIADNEGMLGERMEREISEQVDLFQRLPAQYQAVLSGFDRDFEMVVIAARGSSDHAALYARYLLEIHLQMPVSLAAPSVLTRYGSRVHYPNCLAIGISQSGAAPDVAEIIGTLREQGHATLAITNTPGSRLTEAAERTLHLETGDELSVAATKTYSASLLAVYQLCRALGADLPDPVGLLPGDDWLKSSGAFAEEVVDQVVGAEAVFALARGYGFATALETGLKLMECALIPCRSYSVADFQHGPRALAGPGTTVIGFGSEPLGLEGQECSFIHPGVPPAHEALHPIWDILFSQQLALLAARDKGLNPDDPRHLKKVTETL